MIFGTTMRIKIHMKYRRKETEIVFGQLAPKELKTTSSKEAPVLIYE
jgi:hypothetical protein